MSLSGCFLEFFEGFGNILDFVIVLGTLVNLKLKHRLSSMKHPFE